MIPAGSSTGQIRALSANAGRFTARQTSLIDAIWIPVKDGDDTGRAIFENHYSRRKYFNGRFDRRFCGPGEKMVLLTPDALALFVWRKFFSMDHQEGINCAIFRNEGTTAGRSSDLIRAAMELAWERWPGQRLYTYVDPRKVSHKRDPGRCFLRAGWRHFGWAKHGQRILEALA